ncbi:50S ribosomal protein L29 [Treponema endosymbiont of Eucomonympha sp.]|uniref:50S ribosomal protein L29 n=1 Tax=Treponema endosymbiont of Eucomonympha sp. TaxID=1580831 RepID=UPI000750D2CE|nr:50S ribosomal protein L29 [Treponema endosymbiont of Eucomonympha sp.]
MTRKKENDKLSYAELLIKRNELKKKYMDFRFQMIMGHIENKMKKHILRREIARLNTFIGGSLVRQNREE